MPSMEGVPYRPCTRHFSSPLYLLAIAGIAGLVVLGDKVLFANIVEWFRGQAELDRLRTIFL